MALPPLWWEGKGSWSLGEHLIILRLWKKEMGLALEVKGLVNFPSKDSARDRCAGEKSEYSPGREILERCFIHPED